MGKIPTKEIFDLYFSSPGVSGTSAEKNRKQIDRPELYAYEMKIGKELIDMDSDEIFNMVLEFKNKRKGKEIGYMVSHYSYDKIVSMLRAVFDFYIDNVEVVRNPCNNKNIRGVEAVKRLSASREVFTWKNVEEIIENLHRDRDEDNADYIELIMLMYYNGFSKAEEIVLLTEDMIDHENRTVSMNGATLQLSDRCYELLKKFNRMEYIAGWRGDYLLATWRGGYFKFIIRPREEDRINDRPLSEMRDNLNRHISMFVNKKYGTKISYNTLYLLGFYENMRKKFGADKTNQIIKSFRNPEDTAMLMDAARKYGMEIDQSSYLKRMLMPLVRG